MLKTYTLKGLDCANCAAKIENAVGALEGVSAVSMNFMASKLQVEAGDDRSITKRIKKIVHSHEPDVVVMELEDEGHAHAHGEEGGRWEITKLLTGAAIFLTGIILSRFDNMNTMVLLAIYAVSYLLLGGEIVLRALKNIARGRVFDENFLMSVATIGAFAIGETPEAVAVMLFFQIGEYFQRLAVRRSKKSIAGLMDIRPDYANLIKDGEIIRVSPETVKVGDAIIVKPGEKIPLDGRVTDGESMLDTKALTGESVPRSAKPSDTVLSGCINLNGVLTIEVTKEYRESTVAKIIDLVENASGKKAPTENFITTFSRYYTPIIVGMALLLAVLPPLIFHGGWADWIHRSLVFLVISCPCALVVSIPLGFFGGIGGASRKGILVKGGNFLEALNHLDIVVFDKTGTLTKGVFEVTSICPENGFTEDTLLELAANAETFSNHPIALSVLKAYDGVVNRGALTEYQESSGQGVSVLLSGKAILAGNNRLMAENDISFTESQNPGTKVYVAVDGAFAGCIVISDEIKPDSQKSIAALKSKGVSRTVMLTGDDPQIAKAVADKLGLDEVHGGLLPAQKVEMVELLNGQKRAKGKLAFVGDGINDAPVLARADIGIAMGGLGSDAAIEAADVVLMTDEPGKLADAIDVARFTKRVVWQNIIFSLGVKGIVLLLGAFGVASMWEAVFADVGVALLAVLNATRVMRKSPS